ncbi:MAG: DoxX family membrane protein [Chloroflexi bacterium]|nr:DoxX family membrane protein [Chloroflexota bacterium]
MTTHAVALTGAPARTPSGVIAQDAWRLNGLGLLRIVFGIIWLIDAWFKWQPEFIGKFTDFLTGALDGQPAVVQAWINLWINIVNVNPRALAYLVALGETAIAVGLIFGLFSNLTYLGGILLSLVIWSTAEGFGGPYAPGSTDIGSAVIYVLVFAGLFLTSSGLYLGLDRRLTPLLGRWGGLASGSLRSNE